MSMGEIDTAPTAPFQKNLNFGCFLESRGKFLLQFFHYNIPPMVQDDADDSVLDVHDNIDVGVIRLFVNLHRRVGNGLRGREREPSLASGSP
jgi:hypothetical protein